jgi:glucose-1-phosphate adenylyltransferase
MRVDTTQIGLDASAAEKRPFLASMGIYVFNLKSSSRFFNEDKERVDFGGEIIPAAIEKLNVQAHFSRLLGSIGTIALFTKRIWIGVAAAEI